MESAKQCMLCGKELATHSCGICGAIVGQACFDGNKGVCKACSAGKE